MCAYLIPQKCQSFVLNPLKTSKTFLLVCKGLLREIQTFNVFCLMHCKGKVYDVYKLKAQTKATC